LAFTRPNVVVAKWHLPAGSARRNVDLQRSARNLKRRSFSQWCLIIDPSAAPPC